MTSDVAETFLGEPDVEAVIQATSTVNLEEASQESARALDPSAPGFVPSRSGVGQNGEPSKADSRAEGASRPSQLPDGTPVDDVLRSALFDAKDRRLVLRVERSLVTFLRTPQQTSLELDPMNSYLRLISHKVGEYYGIGHVSNYDGTRVVYFRHPWPPRSVTRLADIKQPTEVSDEDKLATAGSSSAPESPKAGTEGDDKTEAPRRVVLAKRPAILKKPAAEALKEAPVKEPESEERELEKLQGANDDMNELHKHTDRPLSAGSLSRSQTPSVNGESRDGEGDGAAPGSTLKGLSFEARVAAYEEARARIFKGFTEEAPDEKPAVSERSGEFDHDYMRGHMRPSSSSSSLATRFLPGHVDAGVANARFSASSPHISAMADPFYLHGYGRSEAVGPAAPSFQFTGQTFTPVAPPVFQFTGKTFTPARRP